MKKANLIFLTCVFCITTEAQISPSLTASTSKIAYEKGKLDSELIAQIIATKQEEIKKELMNRTVLNCLECGPFATWNYARQSMDVLLTERDSKVITKELLKYTTELAVVMAISEYYLRFLSKRSKEDKLNEKEAKLLLQYFKWMDLDSKRAINGHFIKNSDAAAIYESQESQLAKLELEDLTDVSQYKLILTHYSYLKKDKIIDDFRRNAHQGEEQISNKKNELSNNADIPGTSDFLKEIIFLKQFNNSTKDYLENKSLKYNPGLKTPCNKISPNHILIDFIYDICRNNSHLKRYGFFQNIGVNDSIYKYKNKYTIFHNEIGKDFGGARQEIEALIDVIFGSFTAIKEMYKSGKQILNVENIESEVEVGDEIGFDSIVASIKSMKMDSLNDDIKEDWNAVLDDVIKLTKHENNQGNDLLYFIRENIKPKLIKINIASKSNLDGLIENLDKYEKLIKNKTIESLKIDFKRLTKILNDNPINKEEPKENLIGIVEELKGKVPQNLKGEFDKLNKKIDSLSIAIEGSNKEFIANQKNQFEKEFNEFIKNLKSDKKLRKKKALKKLLATIDSLKNATVENLRRDFSSSAINIPISETKGIDLRDFIQLVNTVNSLENPATYDIIAKFIANLGGIFGDNSAITVLNQFVNDFDKYLLVDSEKDQLDINVEDIAVDLFERFGKNQSSAFSMYLSVGVNNSKVINSAMDEPSSLNFVSEKIGFKYKIFDWNKRVSYGVNERSNKNKRIKQYHRNAAKTKPILGDMHALIYVSGLLYQIDFLNSESEQLTNPIVGVGVGFSFFNGLDLNFSYAIPTNYDFSFWNIGFDIKITEYLAELGKKNRTAAN